MSDERENPYSGLWCFLVWLGVLGNLVFSVQALFAPRYLLNMLHMPQVSQTVWLRDSGGLLLLLSLMQAPSARRPFRYWVNAVITVAGRVGFGLFWFYGVFYAGWPSAFLSLAIADSSIGLLQLIVFMLLMRHEYLRPELSPTYREAM